MSKPNWKFVGWPIRSIKRRKAKRPYVELVMRMDTLRELEQAMKRKDER